jgi:D-xylose 1-dehydrogenase (NADP+, D-xylono-1,5-lactone-forming)
VADRIKWGVLGYARIARVEVIPAILRSQNAEFYAVASRDTEKLKECQKEFQCSHMYTSYDELLDDPNVQAVYIPLPNSLHKEWAMKALSRGKHVLCEKPIALNADECAAMIQCAEQNGVLLMEAFMYRYTDRTRKVEEIIQSGEIGEIKFIDSVFRFHLNRPNTIKIQPELGGGSLYDVGCYPLNFVGMLTKELPDSCSVQAIIENGVDLMFSAVMKYPSGIIANIHSGFNAFPQMGSEVVGTLGRIEISDTFSGVAGQIKVVTKDGARVVEVNESDRYTLEVEDFSNAILHGTSPKFPLEETERNMKVLDMLMQQMPKHQ